VQKPFLDMVADGVRSGESDEDFSQVPQINFCNIILCR
jgi:hypothetical protein